MKKVFVFASLVVMMLLASAMPVSAGSDNSSLGVNVLLNTEIIAPFPGAGACRQCTLLQASSWSLPGCPGAPIRPG